MKLCLPALALLLLLCPRVRAQGFGLNPPAVDWQAIENQQVRVIFPRGYDARAQRVAQLIELLAVKHGGTLGEQLYDFDLVLQTPNTTINGYVGLAPFRSEFFVTPPNSLGLLSNADWVDLLTIHEFRHVQQASSERVGLTKLFYYLQGQTGWAVFSALATPNWFSEGDAVWFETELSPSGRGRTPAFLSGMRALLDEDIIYPYRKARNGSFKDLVPDHYRYGYLMVDHAREKFGDDVWGKVLREGAAYRGLIYPFSRALKRQTELTTKELYREALGAEAREQADRRADLSDYSQGERIGPETDKVVFYRYPFRGVNGALYALKTGFQIIPALVRVGESGGRDEVVHYLPPQREPFLRGQGSKVVYLAYDQHPRFTNLNYSDVVVYSIKTGAKRRLTERGKYTAATLSFDGTRVAALSYDPGRGPTLVILEVATGVEIERFDLPDRAASWPNFSADGQGIYYLGLGDNGLSLMEYRIGQQRTNNYGSAGYQALDHLLTTPEGEILLSQEVNGVDQISYGNTLTGAEAILTANPVGAYYPYLDGNELIYVVPTPHGSRLHRRTIELPNALPTDQSDYPEKGIAVTERSYPDTLPIRDFPDNFGGIKLHSWSYNGSYVQPGLEVVAENALATTRIIAGAEYNYNEDRWASDLEVTYGGLYPEITLSGQFRARNVNIRTGGRDTFLFANQEFDQLSIGAKVGVPLRWVSGAYGISLRPEISYEYLSIQNANEGPLSPDFSDLGGGLNFSVLRRQAYQQVQPRLGLTTNLAYNQASGGDRLGQRTRFNASAFLPGAWRTHGIRLDLGLRGEQLENLYQYPDVFRYARGYNQPLNDRAVRLSANYQLPVLYPDWGFAGLVYFRRVRLNAFYDWERITIDETPSRTDLLSTRRSLGGELFFDNTYLNTAEVTLGVQLAYRLDADLFSRETNDWRFRFLAATGF